MNVNHPFVPTYSTQPTVCSRFTTSSKLVLNFQATTEPNSQNVFKVERMHKILNKYLLLAIPSEIRKVQG